MEKVGRILRIEKISLNDGRGMRTVVFFKGCPLKCAWCSTPESQYGCPEVYYMVQKCLHCGKCIQVCDQQALKISDNGIVVRNNNNCRNCFKCVRVCPTGAQNIYGKEMTVKEVMKHIHRDEVFFYHSGGGVTLSGGDILAQAEFAQSILMECVDSGIDTMAEMDFYGDYEKVAMLLPYIRNFYADIKMMDSSQHLHWTGVSNESILNNIKRVSQECRKGALHIRVPLIWNINDSKENIEQTAKFCAELADCAELEFLPYHRLGQATYGYLGRDYGLKELLRMSAEEAAEKVGFLKKLNLSFPIKIAGEPLEKYCP